MCGKNFIGEMKLSEIVYEFSHLFFPNCCVICGTKLLSPEESVCLKCLYKLPKTNDFKEVGNGIETLLAGRFPFERAASFCEFSKGGMFQSIIHHIKYNHREKLGVAMGRLFGQDLLESDFICSIDVIVPVPLHPKKQRERGYNQSERIAEGFSEVTAIPISRDNLVRIVYNPTQTRLSKTQRWENVKNIFKVTNPSEFSEKHILLVDDVVTTGSTLEACAIALGKCSNIKISVATLARVL
jgi:ComF family protein